MSRQVFAYLGIWVIIGLVPCPKYRKCWSNNRVLQHDIIAEVMSRHRFDQVTPFHPRGGSSSIPGEQDIEAAINRRILKYSFASTFVPEDIVIGESLWKFCGLLDFKTFKRSKRLRLRLVYKLCASTGPAAVSISGQDHTSGAAVGLVLWSDSPAFLFPSQCCPIYALHLLFASPPLPTCWTSLWNTIFFLRRINFIHLI